MREAPSPELTALLDQLALVSRAQLRAAARRARSLARELPLFDSVWVDALVQMRLLTPFQAREIHAGRGRQLQIAGYVLCEPLASLGYATRYRARTLDTQREVWLDLCETPQVAPQVAEKQLATLVAQLQRSVAENVVPALDAAGVECGAVWTAGAALPGTTAADWVVRNGRLPPQAVLEIARQLAARLAQLEAAGLLHGDLHLANVVLGDKGDVQLAMPGLRPIVRPEEGHTFADLVPHAYDYLAPERIADGTPPTCASDLYALGCVCWHLLAGRPPLAGGNSLAKLKAAQAAKILDVRRVAPETPAPLAAAMAACVQRDPPRRPASMAQLATALGPSTRAGRMLLAATLARRAPRQAAVLQAARALGHSRHTPVWTSAVAGSLLMLLAVGWPLWRPTLPVPLASIWARGSETLTATATARPPEPQAASTETIPAAAPEPAAEQPALAPEPALAPAELVLPSDHMTRAESLRLEPGQTVRSAAGTRAQVLVSGEALSIAVEGVRFERIDFVAAPPESSATSAPRALLMVAASEVEFAGCSFSPADSADARWSAIEWQDSRPHDSPSAARLRFTDCTFRQVRAGVDCQRQGPLLIEWRNSLHLGAGPLWRLRHLPRVDEVWAFVLRDCTLRGSTSLMDMAYADVAAETGRISIEANDCVLAPKTNDASALVRLAGDTRPEPVLQMLSWSGQGSLLTPKTPFAAWYDQQAKRHLLDDALVNVDGLVRAEFGFAAGASEHPSDSEIAHWAAPLRSDEPPGIRPAPLALPEL